MTSATAKGSTSRSSRAQVSLDIVLGEKRVALSDLYTSELQELLKSQLDYRDTRDLHGFEELRSALRRRGDEPLEVSSSPVFRSLFLEEFPFDLKSHVVRVSRFFLFQEKTWCRLETGEETSDYEKAAEWGKNKYLIRGEESLLFMRRLIGSSCGADILAEVTYKYTKIPHEEEWVIGEISAQPVPIQNFCRHFGKKAPEVAMYLLWELSSIYSQTVDAMERKAHAMRVEATKRENLSHRVG